MLKAFRNQLNQLSLGERESWTQRVAAGLGGAVDGNVSEDARGLILALPDLLERVRRWYDRADVPENFRRLHGITLAYLYHPADLVEDKGFFGYLDDAYLVGRVFVLTAQRLARDGAALEVDVAAQQTLLGRQLASARRVLPEEANRLDALVADYLSGDLKAFRRLMDETENQAVGKK